MSTRLSQLIVLLLAIAAGLGVGYGLWGAERSQSTTSASATRVSDNGEALRLDALADARRRARARLERLQPPSGDEERALRSPRTPRYAVHREKGRTLGVPRVTATSEIDAHVEAGRLVPLVDTEYYVVRALEHSAPFVTPDLRQLLSEIGERFQRGLAERGLPPYRFVISSALRTPALQEDLRQSNRNAASQASSHEYGVSVDIVTWRYAVGSAPDSVLALPSNAPNATLYQDLLDDALMAYGYRYWDHLFGLMTRILTEAQRRGEAVVLLESEQPVFHVTVGRRFD